MSTTDWCLQKAFSICLYRDWASQVARWWRICLPRQEMRVQYLGQEDPLQPTSMLLPGKFHGQRSLVACCPRVAESRTQLSDWAHTAEMKPCVPAAVDLQHTLKAVGVESEALCAPGKLVEQVFKELISRSQSLHLLIPKSIKSLQGDFSSLWLAENLL